MSLPSSGAISLGNYNTELEYASNAQISLNDPLIRNLNKVYTGANSIGAGYGLTGIPASGCVLYLDAKHPSSYPGTGQTWYDISGAGNHFTWASTPSYTSTGVTYFDCGGGNIANGPASNSSSYNLTDSNGYTIIMWAYQYQAGASHAFFWSGNETITSRAIASTVTWSDGVIYWDQGGCCNSDSRTTYNIGTTYGWTMTSYNRNTSTSTRNIWVNNSIVSTNTAAPANMNLNSTGAQVGNSSEQANSGNYWHAYLASFLLYNRSLTNTEIGNIFTATRGRFGV